MAKGGTSGNVEVGSRTQTGTTTSTPSPQVQSLIDQALPGISSLSNFKLPKGTGVAKFDPLQRKGQRKVLKAAAGPLSDIASSAAQGVQFLTSGDVLSPESNPYLAQYGDYLASDLGNQFATSVLPNIRGGARGAGQTGSSRAGIAEALAAEGLSRQTGGSLANLYNTGYGQGLNAFTQGLALSPEVGQLQLAPGLAISGVGDVRQQHDQAVLDAQRQNATLEQLLPFLTGSQILGVAGQLPGGTVTTTGTSGADIPRNLLAGGKLPGEYDSTLNNVLGGAAQGASLGSTLFPGIGTGVGAGIGALLPFLYQ